jgi:hypothetical protein
VNTNPSSSSIEVRFVPVLLAIRSLDLRLLEGGELISITLCLVPREAVVLPFTLCGGVAGGESG